MIFSDELQEYLEKFKSEVIAEAESVLNSNLDDYHASMSADFDTRIKKLNAYRESLDEYGDELKKTYIEYVERVVSCSKIDRDENRTRHQEMLHEMRINSMAILMNNNSIAPDNTRAIDKFSATINAIDKSLSI